MRDRQTLKLVQFLPYHDCNIEGRPSGHPDGFNHRSILIDPQALLQGYDDVAKKVLSPQGARLEAMGISQGETSG